MMSAKNLRDSILQMAVEGKLVEQREEEGTAADLLASIREQRAQLVREKKAKPVKGGESFIWRDDDGHWFERRGKGEAVCIDDEIPFDIPDSWCWARLGEMCNFGTCVNIEYEDVREGTWNLDLEDLEKDSGVILRKKRKHAGEKGSTKHVFEEGAVLYSKLRPYLNKVGIADEDGVCTSEILPLRFKGIEAQYAQLFLMSPYFVVFANSHVSGTKMPRLKVAEGTQCLMPVPSFAEQSRIVAAVSKLLPLANEYGKAQEQREQLDRELPIKLRKSILQAAVEGKLIEQSDDDEPASLLLAGIREKRAQLVREGKVKPVKGGESIIYRDDAGHWFERRGKSDPVCIDEEIPFDIPDSWCWARLGDLIDLRSGIDLDKKLYSDTERIGIPYITGASNLQNGQVLENRWTDSPRRKSMKGDLLLTCKGTIGEMAYNPFPVAHIARQIMAIKAIDDRMLEYIRLFLLFYVDKVKKAAKGVIPGIERADITGALIPIPALAEQCRIVEKVDAALQQANMHL
ncbi:restriction endonuclease subunit S [Bifidobacterium pseudolongum]|uniref:restriction endonuclease subunit S n=1 Tax=Bifidobacterium pseudolongum TaxID=1694 RepID=UPI0010216F62|nr:restriction endonuclease subunit S [Bifidobacterium pseudolongum]RYQ46585.1 type I restriction enzyme specificity protein [Bifidobacterium pseudolongum subsp. globosum]